MSAASTEGPSPLWPAVYFRHFGTWEGKYTHIDPTNAEVLDEHRCKIEVAARGLQYTQRNTYEWDDGRKEVYYFPAVLDETTRNLVFHTERLDGYAKPIDDDCIAFYASYRGILDTWDFIRLLTDTTRARTWQVVKDAKVSKIVHVTEELVSRDDVFDLIEAGAKEAKEAKEKETA